MSKLAYRILFSFALTITFSVSALAQDTHSVWSDSPTDGLP